MSALWLLGAALLLLAVLYVRRWIVVGRLREEQRQARNEFLSFITTRDGQNTRALLDSATKRLHAADKAPLWRWTP